MVTEELSVVVVRVRCTTLHEVDAVVLWSRIRARMHRVPEDPTPGPGHASASVEDVELLVTEPTVVFTVYPVVDAGSHRNAE